MEAITIIPQKTQKTYVGELDSIALKSVLGSIRYDHLASYGDTCSDCTCSSCHCACHNRTSSKMSEDVKTLSVQMGDISDILNKLKSRTK